MIQDILLPNRRSEIPLSSQTYHHLRNPFNKRHILASKDMEPKVTLA